MNAWFFDMDGTLFNSMPAHALAWEAVMSRHQLHFTQADCYRGEGKRGEDVIRECILTQQHREPTHEEVMLIYKEKSDLFTSMGITQPIDGANDLLQYLKAKGEQLWIVTGSAQQSLFQRLDTVFPGIFTRERMVTADDVSHGKPHPEPYFTAWQRSRLTKEQCRVVENAPLGIISGKKAGLFTLAINTGPLPDQDLIDAGADQVCHSMKEIKEICQGNF
ncbi:MAG: HAD hydrolase-like protein [Paludibacteraceae bacterium]|nr:HAD hydrolase-like protein [Paludibacteraceae bacterium]